MITRKLLFAALAVSSIGLAPLPAAAQVSIYLDVAPPAARYEVVPAPRRGYVWQPGVWNWRGERHIWTRGYWVRERPNMYWHPSRWEERDGRWAFERGRWDRQRWAYNERGRGRGPDRDRDGVPDRVDRDRDGDGVPNRVDRDRDGDGVPNRFDSRPDNPNRR